LRRSPGCVSCASSVARRGQPARHAHNMSVSHQLARSPFQSLTLVHIITHSLTHSLTHSFPCTLRASSWRHPPGCVSCASSVARRGRPAWPGRCAAHSNSFIHSHSPTKHSPCPLSQLTHSPSCSVTYSLTRALASSWPTPQGARAVHPAWRGVGVQPGQAGVQRAGLLRAARGHIPGLGTGE
jgi:hypothetical protein